MRGDAHPLRQTPIYPHFPEHLDTFRFFVYDRGEPSLRGDVKGEARYAVFVLFGKHPTSRVGFFVFDHHPMRGGDRLYGGGHDRFLVRG